MSLVYCDDIATVYNNDYRDILDELDFHTIVTDPPYNVHYSYPDFTDSMSEQAYVDLLAPLRPHKTVLIHYPEEFCGHVRDALGKPRRCVSWCYSSNLPRQSRMIGWFGCEPDFTRVKQPYKNPTDKRIQKLIAEGSQGGRLYDWWSDIQLVKNISKEKVSSFSNQIPVALLERILLTTTAPGEVVLDPFFGSGSLYFACKNTGRKCIGVEQSAKHLESFYERLEAV